MRYLICRSKPYAEIEQQRVFKRACSIAIALWEETGKKHEVYDRRAGQVAYTTDSVANAAPATTVGDVE